MSLRAERGFTLIEVLVASVLMLIVLSATLTILDHVFLDSQRNDAQNDTSQAARETADTLVRQLRNLASPTGDSGSTIGAATSYDFTFQTADPDRTWVRYCLLTSNATGTGSRGNGTLYEQTSKTTQGSTTSCPGSGWATTHAVVTGVTNRRAGMERPLFSFVCSNGTTACTANASTLDQTTRVDVSIWVDANQDQPPPEVDTATGVYLRNQNQAPTAQATVQPVTGQAGTYLLNGSASSDPEGRTLEYFWFRSAVPTPLSCEALPPSGSANYLGQGITLTAQLASGAQSIYLVVCDPGDRPGVSSGTVVNVP